MWFLVTSITGIGKERGAGKARVVEGLVGAGSVVSHSFCYELDG